MAALVRKKVIISSIEELRFRVIEFSITVMIITEELFLVQKMVLVSIFIAKMFLQLIINLKTSLNRILSIRHKILSFYLNFIIHVHLSDVPLFAFFYISIMFFFTLRRMRGRMPTAYTEFRLEIEL